MKLSPHLKCFVDYVRDKCDVAGIWQPNYILANTYIGGRIKVSEADLLKIDGGNQFKKLPGGEIFCIGFISFQYGELSENCHPHRKILQQLKKFEISDRVLLGYSKGINTLQEEDTDKDKDKEEEKEEEKEKDRTEKIVLPFQSNLFSEKWSIWLQYRKEMKKPYKNSKSEQAALKQLSEFNESFAIKLIERSIANQWQGLVFDNTMKEFLEYVKGKNKPHDQSPISQMAAVWKQA